MEERIKDKIEIVERYLEEVLPTLPSNFEEYTKSITIKAAAERYFEKIVEALTDIGHMIIKKLNLPQPETDSHIFEILAKYKKISHELSQKLIEAKNMRNILAHLYEKVDDAKVFSSLKEELPKDIEEFITSIEKIMLNEK